MKKIILCLMMVLGLAVGTTRVSAKECGDIVAAPHMYQVAPTVSGQKFNLHTAQSTCYGYNTEVWYSSFKSLPDSWTFSSGNLWMDLYEADVNNADDHVKSYVGWITNKTITSIDVLKVITSGAIDSSGDNQAELYLTFYSSGYYGYSIEKSLFNYKICMN